MSSAKDFKAEAASASQAGNWIVAAEKYSQAIALDPDDATSLANRSAAYLEMGHHAEALQDAKRCRKLDPSHSMGYLREAAVLYDQQKYSESMAPLQEGLAAVSSNNNSEEQKQQQQQQQHVQALKDALLGAERAVVLQQPAAKASLKMMAALEAAQFRQNLALQAASATATDDTTTTTLASRNQHERKAGPLYQVALQNKQDLLPLLDDLAAEKDISDLLFFFILDPHERGFIPVKELSALCHELNPSSAAALLLADSTTTTANADHETTERRITADTLFQILQQVAADNQSTVRDVAEWIIHQKSGRNNNGGSSQQPLSAQSAKESRMLSLFQILDDDGDDMVSFFDCAKTIYAWARGHFNDPSVHNSTKLLLMMDPKDSRRLNYVQFGKIILSLASCWNASMEDVLDDLVLAFAASPASLEIPEFIDEIIVGSSGDNSDGDDSSATRRLDPLTYARSRQLFELLDTNHDGSVDFAELLTGLRRYQQASQSSFEKTRSSTASAQAEKIALKLMGHDEDHNQTLDPEEFAIAMMDFATGVSSDLHQLIDFMCVVVQKAEEDDSYEKAYSAATVAQAASYTGKAWKRSSVITTIADIEEEEEEEEEED